MEKRIFETHNLENKNIPVIFHFDTILRNDIYNLYFNWHRNIEILYITEGEGYVVVSPEFHRAEKGDICVINSNSLHAISTDSCIKYYCLIADSDFLISNGINTDRLEFANIVKSSSAAALFRRIIEEIGSDIPYKSAGVRSSVLDLVLYLARNFVSEERSKKVIASSYENIKLAIGYISSHFDEHLTLDIIADEAGLSKFYFEREFKKATGLTPISYISRLRCAKARKLLSQGRYSIHEIALKCGFESDSYFSKIFRKSTGHLPSYYISKSNIVQKDSNISH